MPVIALFGPTGVGKTAVAIELADRLREQGRDPVAISADALQVYDGLPILTGAPTRQEQQRLEHRLVGFVALDEEFSAGRYMELAHEEIDSALEAGRTPIVVGGTGLYLRAALAELHMAPAPPPELRAGLEERLSREGAPALHAEVASRAPGLALEIEPGDGKRLVRTLELLELGHPPPRPAGDSQLWTGDTRHPTLLVGLTMERAGLYAAIDARVEAMVAAGVVAEVQRAEAAGVSRTARHALGFEELLRGDIEAMKQRTRNYARRQLTWMRKLEGVRLTDVTGLKPGQPAACIAAAAAGASARGPVEL
ncbi:MAG: tRNA (adenosine(37)-N6)-dimethylallyltransferase MiaA [Thermoleophilaceae bacterium]